MRGAARLERQWELPILEGGTLDVDAVLAQQFPPGLVALLGIFTRYGYGQTWYAFARRNGT
jgi:hypothetical protein